MKGLKPSVISILTIGLLAGSAVGVAAQDEAAYVAFELGEPADFVPTDTGFAIIDMEVTASDPRAEGLLTMAKDFASAGMPGGEIVELSMQSIEIVNDEGSWSGTGPGVGAGGAGGGTDINTMVGDGAYAGLTLYLVSDATGEVWGIIADSDLAFPDPPELP